jgi:choline dehydrogenase-like flavoprotein
MLPRRRATLQSLVETLAPRDARVERVVALAVDAIDSLGAGRRDDLNRFLDLLWLPMRATHATRAGVLLALASSPVALLRSGYFALARLTLYLAYAESDVASPNPTWSRIGYPGPRGDGGANDPPLPFAEASAGERITADVVVVGSGAGGGVAASAFARAGKRVVVLEAGAAFDANAVTQRELAMSQMYLDAGLTSSHDLGVTILAGATLGGGTTVNWCTSLRLPERIAAEWEAESGIAGLARELAPHYDALDRKLGLEPVTAHNRNNACIVEGARALELHAAAMPRNAPADCGDGCGYCGYGCAYGKKRSTSRAFLPDVGENGGAIYVRAEARSISLSGSRATAVTAYQTVAEGDVRRFEIAAELVVVAGGTLRTPGLLARSGIRHPLLGKQLFLHPVSALFCRYPEPIDAFLGPMQSAYSDAFAYLDGNYGAKIEAAPAHPGLAALALPWEGRARHARAMDGLRYAAAMLAVVHDRDPGSIDLDDEARIRYTVSPFDGEHLLAGIAGMADLAFAAGALEIATMHARPIRIARDAWTPQRRATFVEDLNTRGFASNRQPFFSAHQMGTACMGSNPQDSVVDPAGRVWGYENLLVVDGSIFPQSSGVNPMLTIMAMASRVAAQHGGLIPESRLPALGELSEIDVI